MSQQCLEGPNMHKNVPQEQRVWQKDQQVTGNDTKIDPKKGQNCAKMPKKSAFFSSVLAQNMVGSSLLVMIILRLVKVCGKGSTCCAMVLVTGVTLRLKLTLIRMSPNNQDLP